jgi:hypothetical protein
MMDGNGLLSPTALSQLVSLQSREPRAAISASFKNIAEQPAPIAAETMRRLFALEEKLSSVIQNDKRWFFNSPNDPEADMFARDLASLHTIAAKTLTSLIERRGEWSESDQDPLLVRAIAFALFHHATAIKWGFFRHEPVKATTWPQLHRLYQLAETLGTATTGTTLRGTAGNAYPATHEQTSITAIYAHGLLLDLFNTGSLSTAQIEIIDGWLGAWAVMYRFDAEYVKDSHALLIDLDSIAGLQIVTGTPSQSSHRYLCLTGFTNQLEATRGDLRAGHPFVGRGMANMFAMEDYVALLSVVERLNANILQTSARRIEERKVLADTYAEVEVGFTAALAVVTNKDAAASNAIDQASGELSFGGVTLSLEPMRGENPDAGTNSAAADQPKKTPWRVHDMTSKGIGIIVERALAERMQVGRLLSLRLRRDSVWMLGNITRKIEHRSAGEALLGIEILSHTPLPLTLRAMDEYGDAVDAPPMHAIYLPGANINGRRDLIVVNGDDAEASNGGVLKTILSAQTGRGNFDLRLNRVAKKGEDWIGLRFDVVAQH